MSIDLLPEWEEFERDYVAMGIPHRIVVRTAPAAEMFLDAGAARLGAWFERPDGSPTTPIPLREIHTEEVLISGSKRIAVWTDQEELFPKFYGLLKEVLSLVVNDDRSPLEALSAAVAEWDILLDRTDLLSPEAQAGLFGELWLLERLIQSLGPEAVQAWTGPRSEAHDFRLANVEIEVKTTTGARRIHMINGVGQLQPSPGVDLYLLSLPLADGGVGGHPLPELIAAVEGRLPSNGAALLLFRDCLAQVGYRDQDAVHYTRRRKLRGAPALIKIEDGVPRMTSAALNELPARFAPERFGRIVYEIDVEGLGVEDGSAEFLSLIPKRGDNT